MGTLDWILCISSTDTKLCLVGVIDVGLDKGFAPI